LIDEFAFGSAAADDHVKIGCFSGSLVAAVLGPGILVGRNRRAGTLSRRSG
jgi:Na+/H+ antiporter NhaA